MNTLRAHPTHAHTYCPDGRGPVHAPCRRMCLPEVLQSLPLSMEGSSVETFCKAGVEAYVNYTLTMARRTPRPAPFHPMPHSVS